MKKNNLPRILPQHICLNLGTIANHGIIPEITDEESEAIDDVLEDKELESSTKI